MNEEPRAPKKAALNRHGVIDCNQERTKKKESHDTHPKHGQSSASIGCGAVDSAEDTAGQCAPVRKTGLLPVFLALTASLLKQQTLSNV